MHRKKTSFFKAKSPVKSSYIMHLQYSSDLYLCLSRATVEQIASGWQIHEQQQNGYWHIIHNFNWKYITLYTFQKKSYFHIQAMLAHSGGTREWISSIKIKWLMQINRKKLIAFDSNTKESKLIELECQLLQSERQTMIWLKHHANL